MNQSERRQILIRSLLNERAEYQKIEIPHSSGEQKNLFRSPYQQGISADSRRIFTGRKQEQGVCYTVCSHTV